MEITPERMVALPADGELHPVYLIAGPETLRVLEAADSVRRRAGTQGVNERAVFDADGRDFDWGVDLASTRSDTHETVGPYADDRKLVLALGPSFFDAAGVAHDFVPQSMIAW